MNHTGQSDELGLYPNIVMNVLCICPGQTTKHACNNCKCSVITTAETNRPVPKVQNPES